MGVLNILVGYSMQILVEFKSVIDGSCVFEFMVEGVQNFVSVK